MSKKRTYTVYQEYWSDDEQSYEEQEIDVTVIYSRQPAGGPLTFQIVKMRPRIEVDEDIDRQIVEAIEGEEAAIADWQAEREWSHQQEEK